MTAAAVKQDRPRVPPAPAADETTSGASLPMIEVLLVDDDRSASYGLWALLNWRPEIRVSATAETSREAIDLVARLRPGVCLIAATLGRGEGIRLAHRLKQLAERPRVLIYTARQDPQVQAVAALAGADAVSWRYADPDELADRIVWLAAGRGEPPVIAPKLVTELIDHVADRDRPITSMLLLGIPPDEVARTIGISRRALNARRCEIVARLSRSAAAPAPTRGASRAAEHQSAARGAHP
jgi:DNA-binding NarL/FixJ family response regulator